jgi:hypothetical protein
VNVWNVAVSPEIKKNLFAILLGIFAPHFRSVTVIVIAVDSRISGEKMVGKNPPIAFR